MSASTPISSAPDRARIATFFDHLVRVCVRPGRVGARLLELLREEAEVVAEDGFAPTDARRPLERLLLAEDPTPGLHALFDTELGALVLPEVAALDLDQGGRRLHKDNLRHSITVTGRAPARLRLRWACLLHDVGKAPTRQIVGTKVTFYNHEAVGERLSRALLTRLGYDADFAAQVGRLVAISGRTHSFDGDWTDAAVRRFAVDAGELLEDALDLSRADCTSARPGRRAQVLAQVDAVADRLAAVASADAAAEIRPALDGHEIMELLGLGPGPQVGKAYRFLLERARAGELLDHDEAVEALRAFWTAGQKTAGAPT